MHYVRHSYNKHGSTSAAYLNLSWLGSLCPYLDVSNPCRDSGPGEEEDGPGQYGPRGPEAHGVQSTEGWWTWNGGNNSIKRLFGMRK